MDDYRFRAQQSPRNEAPMNSLVSPPRNGNRTSQIISPSDPRGILPRRFTTDSGRVPTLSSITTQRAPEQQDYANTTQYKVQLLEKKKIEYERLREQKRRFEAEMMKLDQQQRRDEMELAQMHEDLGRNGMGMTGHQSEPTTPPEYRDTSSGFPTMFSRPNRYSTSSLVSPPGIFNRPGRSGSQLASPQSSIMQSRFFDDGVPSRSVPGSRRNSDEDEKEEALRQDPTSHRSTNATNRYSMPVTKRGNLYDSLDHSLDHNNTTRFLFGDDDTAGGDSGRFTDTADENFPKLFAQKGNPNMLSASTAAVDLATQLPSAEQVSANGWGNISRHRPQQSLSTLSSTQLNGADSGSSTQTGSSDATTMGSRNATFRHSLDMKYFTNDNASNDASPNAAAQSANNNNILATPPKLQTSFSTNDVPTMKNAPGPSVLSPNANAHAQQHFHNHNASIGRIPIGAVPNRHSRELSNENHGSSARENGGTYPSIQSALQANAPSFGPSTTQPGNQQSISTTPGANAPAGPYTNGYYGPNGYNPTSPNSHSGTGYGVPLLAMGMQNLSMNGGSVYPPQNYSGYGSLYPANQQQQRDSQARVIQARRQMDNEAMSRFNNLPLESVGGTIYDLCKDQHGCRYLQKQLENRDPEQVHMIWLETNQHVIELMTDPFGNYLCQKLLEYCTDDERTILIQNAAQDMVRIALNQHGTRALQKMIEFVTIPQHVAIIIDALRDRVVDLIQDLNGNHVIQKCLNKLSAADAQFIFNAVGNHVIEVGTHRHGCCVLQRCIDHATGEQKMWLIERITDNATRLVQDPFGNYVVQYVIDLNEPVFTEPLVGQFRGKIVQLSRHKFSSNVIEKCLRCASEQSRDLMCSELLSQGEMERLLRDSFGNYVVQTALEHATFPMKHQLADAIRPTLPNIRTTPYGRRLQAKIQQFDSRSGSSTSGQVTPADPTQGQIPLRPANSRGLSNNTSILSPNGYSTGFGNAGRGQSNYPSSTVLTVPPPQPTRAQSYQSYTNGNGHPEAPEGQFF